MREARVEKKKCLRCALPVTPGTKRHGWLCLGCERGCTTRSIDTIRAAYLEAVERVVDLDTLWPIRSRWQAYLHTGTVTRPVSL